MLLILPIPALLLLLPLSVAAKKKAHVQTESRRRDIRHLPDPMFDALGQAHDPRLEEFLDWEKDGGLLKDILIPRARKSSSSGCACGTNGNDELD